MNISYKNTKTAKQFVVGRSLVKIHGPRRARLITERLIALEAAPSLAFFWPPYSKNERCHELTTNRSGQFSMDLDHPYRLIFVPKHDPVPRRPDGGTDWQAITDIIILGVEDTHD